MKLDLQINKMYQEIVSYSGNFGDPIIDTINYDPFKVIDDPNLSDFQKEGVFIAILSWAMTVIDSSGHTDALKGDVAGKVKAVLHNHERSMPQTIQKAFKAFFVSEEVLVEAFGDIYKQVVLPKISEPYEE